MDTSGLSGSSQRHHLPVQANAFLDGVPNAQTITSEVSRQVSQRHPCFGGAAAHTRYGRIHLPVAPSCNIHCRFCTRGIDAQARRPGTACRLLKPEEAVSSVEKALALCPDISVVGVAGPGDALASDHALAALREVHERFPELLKCLSTNGLRLAERADEVWAAGVRSITVTVNAVDPTILTELCSRIVLQRRVIRGTEAAEILIEQQLEGIRRLSQLGAVVKVNTVLVPGVNDQHVEDIVTQSAAAGAHVANIIPLIPNGEFRGYLAPNAQDLETARKIAESHLAVYRTCRQCRADACGVPGTGIDFARQVFGNDVVEGSYFSHG